MGKGGFAVSLDILPELLHLPKGTEIDAGEMDIQDGLFWIAVRHPDIPEDRYYRLCPTFRSVDGKPEFAGWGLPTKSAGD